MALSTKDILQMYQGLKSPLDDEEDLNSGGGLPDAPAPEAKPVDPNLFTSPESLSDLRQTQQTRLANAAIADNLASRKSMGDFMLGNNVPHSTAATDYVKNSNAILEQAPKDRALLRQEQDTKNEYDPNHPISRVSQSVGISAVKSLADAARRMGDDQTADAYDDLATKLPGMSAHEINETLEKNPLLKQEFQNSAVGQKVLSALQIASQKNQLGQDNLDEKKRHNGESEDIARARLAEMEKKYKQSQDRTESVLRREATYHTKELSSDPVLRQAVTRAEGATRILDQMSEALDKHAFKYTPQLENDINQEYAALMKGANNTALGSVENVSYKNLASRYAAFQQFLHSNAQNIDNPDVQKQLRAQVKSLKKEYGDMIVRRFDTLAQPKMDAFADGSENENPYVRKLIESQRKQYSKYAASDDDAKGGSDPKINEYAQKYKMSYDQADKLLRARGYKPNGQ